MKIILFGLGSIGTRHGRLLKKNFKHDIYAFRSKHKNVNEIGVPEITTWKQVDDLSPDVALITNPTSRHASTAIQCAQRGMHLFIEKPIDSDLKAVQRLKKAVSKSKVSTYVAYVLRFHPVIQLLKKHIEKNTFYHMRIFATSYLPGWRLRQNYLKSYSAISRLGGGVIYDLSHEFDYVQYLLGPIKEIRGQFSKRSHVTVNTEDYADILIKTKKGPVNVHISYLSQKRQRIIQLDFKEKTVEGDLLNGIVREFRKEKLIKKTTFKNAYMDSFKKQLQFYFKNLNNRRMMNNLSEASLLFEKIYRFKTKGSYDG